MGGTKGGTKKLKNTDSGLENTTRADSGSKRLENTRKRCRKCVCRMVQDRMVQDRMVQNLIKSSFGDSFGPCIGSDLVDDDLEGPSRESRTYECSCFLVVSLPASVNESTQIQEIISLAFRCSSVRSP